MYLVLEHYYFFSIGKCSKGFLKQQNFVNYQIVKLDERMIKNYQKPLNNFKPLN